MQEEIFQYQICRIHYDIVNLSMGKLVNCVLAYKEVVDKDVDGKLVVRYSEGQIKDILKKLLMMIELI